MKSIRALAGQWLAGNHAAKVVAFATFLLCLPSVWLPPAIDDHGFRHRILVEGADPNEVFRFSGRIERSAWWSDTSEAHFFRPLAGLSHWLDYRLWPEAIWWMRLQNCVFYALLAWVAARCYRAVGEGAQTAQPVSALTWPIGALMYGFNEANAQTLSCISGRNTFLAALFGLATIWLHHRNHARPGWRARLAGPACFGFGLACGELAIATLGYLAAHALVLDKRAFRKRLSSLAPYLAPLSVWAVLYVRGGYGAHTRMMYRDLFGDPGTTLSAGLADLPIWISTQLSLPYATATMGSEPWLVRLASLPLALLLLWLLSSTLRASPLARFYGLGFCLSLAPLLPTWPQDRVLALASFGAFGLLACFFEWAAQERSRPHRLARVALMAVHLAIAPLLFIPSYLTAGNVARAEDRVERALPSGDSTAQTGVVLVRAPIFGPLAYALSRRRSQAQATPAYSYELFAGDREVRVSRVDDRTLELAPLQGYCATRVECLGDGLEERFHPGDVIELPGMQVEIMSVDGRSAPTRARFRFPTPLEDPSRRWLNWTPDGLVAFDPPRVGESQTLAPLSSLTPFL